MKSWLGPMIKGGLWYNCGGSTLDLSKIGRQVGNLINEGKEGGAKREDT